MIPEFYTFISDCFAQLHYNCNKHYEPTLSWIKVALLYHLTIINLEVMFVII